MNWLDCLRALSAPTTGANYPDAMRTRAWAMKTVNTQLASWTQLRHDTLLYVKQPYTFGGACVYPTGYVEPRLEFWGKFKAMASRTADRIAALTYEGSYPVITSPPPKYDPDTGEVIDPGGLRTNLVSLASIRSRQVSHLRNFATIIGRLETLATKELAQTPFTGAEEKFIDSLIEERTGNGQYSPIKYNGWYPQLFYHAINWSDWDFHTIYGAGAFDALVADVHTDVPSLGDPGSVLHEAVGRVNLLMIAVDNGPDHFVCAGPVLSHYEFEMIGAPQRLSDEDWKGVLQGLNPPGNIEGLKPPPWTRDYLVPSVP